MQVQNYNHFENTLRLLEVCVIIVNEAVDNGTNIEEFKRGLPTGYERDCFAKLKEHCARFIELYDEMDTIP